MPPAQPTFKEAVRFWLLLGFISFGGPAGQIAIMREFLVDKKRWISDSRFLHALNYCMLLPGPEAQQLATYTGWLLHGVRGGLAAGILFVLPSMFILLGLSAIYVVYGTLPWVAAMFAGLKPAVIAIVILAMIKIAGKALLSPLHYAVSAAAFVCIFFLHIPFPLIIIGAITVALLLRRYAPVKGANKTTGKKGSPNERDYFLNAESAISGEEFSIKRLLKQLAVGLGLWIAPLVVVLGFVVDPTFWIQLQGFFTKAALVTFGGAYAVLPYVAQVSVEKLQWLSAGQMIDGLALGETTPGPLIMVLAFVGFMAGYNTSGGSLLIGAMGLTATTYFTFLPCFLFIFIGAPLIEGTRSNAAIGNALSFVSAAVVGVVLNLALYLGRSVLFETTVDLGSLNVPVAIWMLMSVAALKWFKVNMIVWIGISAAVGLLYFLVAG